MNKITLTLLLLSMTTLSYAEMKCEAGKCGGGSKSDMKKEIVTPKKEVLTIKKEPATFKTNEKIYKEDQRVTVKQLFSVITTKVTRQNIAHKQTNYGFVVAKETAKTDVSSWYSGFVEELYANSLYMKVQEGDVLAKVYSPEVYKAKQDYLNSLRFSNQHSSHAMVKSSKIKLELLNVCKEEIADIAKTKSVDRLTTIFAPASGWIFEKNINKGSSFNSNKKLFQIVDLSSVWVEVKIYQNQLAKFDSLKEFNIKIKGYEQTFKAKKDFIYPFIDTKEATSTLRLTMENKNGILKPGMFTTLYANANTASRLVIPRTAVIRKNGTWYAFLATDFKGEYEPIKIQVKALNSKYYELLSGLNENEVVVDNALFMMDSDAQINSIY